MIIILLSVAGPVTFCREEGAEQRERAAKGLTDGSVESKINLKAKSCPRAKDKKGGKVGNNSRRVLVEGLVQEEGNRGNVDNGSYGNSISMVLGVGKNLLVRK
jgi:hypothetical protein